MERIIKFLKPSTKSLALLAVFILVATMYTEVSSWEIVGEQSQTIYEVGYPLSHTVYRSFFIERECFEDGCREAYMLTHSETNWPNLLGDIIFWYLVASILAYGCCMSCKKKK